MMLFSELPDEARLWIFAAHHTLSEAASQALLTQLKPFLDTWHAHGLPVQGHACTLHHRFLLLAGHVAAGEISGCSIDAATRAVHAVGEALGIQWLSPLLVFYRDPSGQIVHTSRGQFRRLIAERKITPETPVFDLSLTTLGALRQNGFEKPASQSWLARWFTLVPSV